jgi:hypothetical protein
MATAICKYCNKVELTFDNAFKSKTGKLIPLDKTSGLPHQCAENPYSQQQQQPQQPAAVLPQQEPTSNMMMMLKLIDAKITRLITNEEQMKN